MLGSEWSAQKYAGAATCHDERIFSDATEAIRRALYFGRPGTGALVSACQRRAPGLECFLSFINKYGVQTAIVEMHGAWLTYPNG